MMYISLPLGKEVYSALSDREFCPRRGKQKPMIISSASTLRGRKEE
jgi:hypothetical protein